MIWNWMCRFIHFNLDSSYLIFNMGGSRYFELEGACWGFFRKRGMLEHYLSFFTNENDKFSNKKGLLSPCTPSGSAAALRKNKLYFLLLWMNVYLDLSSCYLFIYIVCTDLLYCYWWVIYFFLLNCYVLRFIRDIILQSLVLCKFY